VNKSSFHFSMAAILNNLIGGSLVPASTSVCVDVVNPANEEVICQVPMSTAADLNSAVECGLAAFPAWSNLTIKQRAAIMFKFHSLVDQHSDELAQLIVRENGKNLTEALADVAKGNETAEWATSLPQLSVGKTLQVSGGITCQESKVPLGVVAAIVPFNFPAMVNVLMNHQIHFSNRINATGSNVDDSNCFDNGKLCHFETQVSHQ
jgi:malonate-semialdehyde dehydrogenase (acetylating) / methylmalonate-semialdehyde dehydrogenase